MALSVFKFIISLARISSTGRLINVQTQAEPVVGMQDSLELALEKLRKLDKESLIAYG